MVFLKTKGPSTHPMSAVSCLAPIHGCQEIWSPWRRRRWIIRIRDRISLQLWIKKIITPPYLTSFLVFYNDHYTHHTLFHVIRFNVNIYQDMVLTCISNIRGINENLSKMQLKTFLNLQLQCKNPGHLIRIMSMNWRNKTDNIMCEKGG